METQPCISISQDNNKAQFEVAVGRQFQQQSYHLILYVSQDNTKAESNDTNGQFQEIKPLHYIHQSKQYKSTHNNLGGQFQEPFNL